MTSQPQQHIAALQMISGTDVPGNLVEADRLIGEAARRGAKLVALPEYFALIHADETEKVRIRERDGEGPIQNFLADAARRHHVWIVGGTTPLAAEVEDKVRNACLVFNDRGERVARYDKIHLFNFRKDEEFYEEARTIEAGGSVVTFDSPVGKVGLAVCYDLRFPELFRAMGKLDLLVVPAAFTEITGRAHWELLLRARAVENLCYVLAAAQGGRHASGRLTYGDSMVIDPWGVVLNRLSKGPGVVSAEMDAARIEELRGNLPALEHRMLR